MSEATAVNEQITDAIRALGSERTKELGAFTSDLARQALTQAVVMALQNAVAAQQRNYLLRQAMTTALVKQALEAPPEEALKIVEPHLAGDDIADTLKQLRGLLAEIEASETTQPGTD